MGEKDSLPGTAIDDSGFDWTTDEDRASRGELTATGYRAWVRRDRSKVGAALAAGVMVLAILTLVTGQTTAHASLTAQDESVTGNAGQLLELTIAPKGDVHYDGLEAEPSSATIVVSAKLSDSGTWEEVGTTTASVDGLEGTANYSFGEIDLLTATSMSKSDFKTQDGETSAVDVDVRMSVTLADAGEGGSDVTATATDTMTVEVTNEPAGANVGGNTNGGGDAR